MAKRKRVMIKYKYRVYLPMRAIGRPTSYVPISRQHDTPEAARSEAWAHINQSEPHNKVKREFMWNEIETKKEIPE